MEKRRLTILGCGVDALTRKEALEKIKVFLSSGKGHYAVTLNSEMLVRAGRDPQFRAVVNGADLVTADGMGFIRAVYFSKRKNGWWPLDFPYLFYVIFASILCPGKVRDVIPEKLSGIDLICDICGSDFAKGKKFYFLGAEEGVAGKASAALQERYPRIRISGSEAGFFDENDAHAEEAVLGRINASGAELLFVALGAGKQEKWIAAHLEQMPGVRFALGVGGAFDILSGRLRRAPLSWQSHGLEWLWRLLLQPWRFGRIAGSTLRLSWLLFRERKDKMTND